jgi:hypothetical protein
MTSHTRNSFSFRDVKLSLGGRNPIRVPPESQPSSPSVRCRIHIPGTIFIFMLNPWLVFAVTAPLSVVCGATSLPSWTAPQPDPNKPLGGFSFAKNVTATCVFRPVPDLGTYNLNHAAM